MGKLIALELCNFKSWRGHNVVPLGDSYFTSIIGPNGSGKSNCMDAISFVLGIKSSHLRSTHLRDLIYRGRVLKHSKIDANGDVVEDGADGEANGDDAQGGASDEDDEDTQSSGRRHDPHSAWVTAVYEDDAGEEQRWKRTITNSGQSEYRINNRVVTAKQYNDALEAENILIKARNFLVFQGDVEAVASQNARDLTRLLEQISGSLEYAKEYERLKQEKDKADDLQRTKLDVRRGVNGEIRQYQQQKEELDKFEQKRDEKDEAVVTQVLWKLYHFQRTIEDSTAEIQKHQEELKEFRRNVAKFEDRLEEAKREQAKAGREVNKVEREIKRKDKSVEEKENALVPIDEKLSISNKNLETYQKRVADVKKERDSQQKIAESLQKNLATVQKAQERWEDEWQAQQQQAGRALSEQDLQEYQRLRGEVYTSAGETQTQVDNLSRQLRTDEETVNALKSKVESTQTTAEGLKGEIDGLKERRADVDRQLKVTNKDLQAKQVAINTLNSERTRTRQNARELDEKLQQAARRLDEGQYQQRESHKEASQRESVAQLKRIFTGVRGMLHQLCKPKQKKYEVALPIIFGRYWDAVVVDSEKVARDCIAYLKDQRTGQMTFLPLDTITHKQPNANLRGLHRGARLAIDTLEFDTSVERAMNFACGDDMICDDWDIARELKWRRKVDVKMVSLDGRSITKGDLISGGEGPSDKRRRFEDNDIENLRTLVEKLKGDLDGLPNDHKRQLEQEQLQSELSGLQQKSQWLEGELAALDRNIDSKTREYKNSRKELENLRPKYDEQASGLAGLTNQLDSLKASISQVEDRLFANFCQRLGYANIRDYERQHGSLQEERGQKKAEFQSQISRLQNQLNFEKQRLDSTRNRIKSIEQMMTRDQHLVAQHESEKEAIGGELDVLNAEIEQLNEQLDELKSEHEQRGEKVSEARREVEKRSRSTQKTVQVVTALETDIEKATTDRYGVLRTCKVENVAIPLVRGSRKLDALPLEDKILEEEEDADDDTAMDIDGAEGRSRTPRFNDYGIHPDFSELDDELKNDASDDQEAQLVEKIVSIQSELDKMAPNMRSADRLEQTSSKLQDIDREFNDARNVARRATKQFEMVKQNRMELFNKAFAHIKDQIEPVYKDLTKSASWPTGGQAYLDVEDEDEPYLSGVKYHVTPPGKRFRDMEHLSGGEKTMAALALLFAIHTYAPSPFFVLDEVDAALDVANTTKLAGYVREHAGPGMQFVVISLKAGLFQNSETLVGVMRDQSVNSSRALTLDLRKYQPV